MNDNLLKPEGVGKVEKYVSKKRSIMSLVNTHKEKLNKLIDDAKIIVRKNHKYRKTLEYKIIDIKILTKDELIALNYIMYNKYHSNYIRREGGWVVGEIPYVEDKPIKSIAEMQAEFLKNNTVKKIEGGEINYTSKENKIYRSKSYYDERTDYEEVVSKMTHVYDNIRYMTKDGSMDILFKFRKIVTESRSSMGKMQTIYKCTQTNNKTLKTKHFIINELKIQEFVSVNDLVLYDDVVCDNFYKNYMDSKYKHTGKYMTINGSRFMVDESDWDDDDN